LENFLIKFPDYCLLFRKCSDLKNEKNKIEAADMKMGNTKK
jgi:hypothetical protein